MKILITGFVVFVVWSFFSVWLYTDKIKPAMDGPVAIQSIPDPPIAETDSVVEPDVIMPDELLIYFEFNDVRLNSNSQIDTTVIELKTWLDKNPESILSITGHTDNIGTSEYNQTLGLKRAQTVQKYFESKGVAKDKIITDSKGKDQPVAEQTTEEGRAKNRRTVITIKN